MIGGCFAALCANIYKPYNYAVVDESRVNIAVSRKLKTFSFVSNTPEENDIIHGGSFMKTSYFQNI